MAQRGGVLTPTTETRQLHAPDSGAIRLRPAVPADFPFLMALHRAALFGDVATEEGWNDDAQVDALREAFDLGGFQVVLSEGRAIGAIATDTERGDLHLSYLALLPAFQSHGIGHALIAELQRQARDAGQAIWLQVIRGNRASELYERMGFRFESQDASSTRPMRWEPAPER